VHTVPQLPQSKGFTLVSTQLVPHWVVPAGQVVEHTPAEQTCPSAQEIPQPPQLAPSDVMSTHDPPQLVKPA